jgi:predicted nuclease of restriction endonuclease-like RecB superfamily
VLIETRAYCKLGKFICWFETRTHFQSAATDFTFETEEVTGSLFNDEDVEHAVQNVYQIHKKIYRISYQVRNGYC